MKDAWAIYRTVRYECERRALAKGFIRERFANARAEQPAVRAARVAELRQEIAMADYLPAHMSRADRVAALSAEINRLAA